MNLQTSSWGILCVALSLISCPPTYGETSSLSDSTGQAPSDFEAVLRLTRNYFDSLTRDTVEESFRVNRCENGVPVTGQVHAVGVTHVKLDAAGPRAEIIVTVPGTADASFQAHVGPATVFASSNTKFHSEKRFQFDGIRFTPVPATATASSCTRVNEIRPRRKGPIGKIVKKAGRCIADRDLNKINQAVNEFGKEMIVDLFDETGEELLGKLDELSVFDETIEKYFPETRDFEYQLATTDREILVAVGPTTAEFPDLPEPKADVELWIKTRPIEAAFIQLVADWEIAHDLLREYVPEEEARAIADDISVESGDGWTVIRVGANSISQ